MIANTARITARPPIEMVQSAMRSIQITRRGVLLGRT
jgi:hypothetical protein